MAILYSLYLKVNGNEKITAGELDSLMLESSVTDFQVIALLSGILFRGDLTNDEKLFLEHWRLKFSVTEDYLGALLGIMNGEKMGEISPDEYELLYDVYWGIKLGNSRIFSTILLTSVVMRCALSKFSTSWMQ